MLFISFLMESINKIIGKGEKTNAELREKLEKIFYFHSEKYFFLEPLKEST